MSRNTAWKRTLTSLATFAVAGAAVLMMTGCGPSPAYDQREPRVPVSYMQQQEGEPEPLTSEELAAQNAARGPQQADQAPVPGPNDIAVGADSGDTYSDTDPSALTEFRPALEGHGQWVDDSTYGTIWVPAESEVGADFTPYTTAGHWTYDDAQNYVWVSDYSWGWAPFHYGRWVHVHRGWAWIPGRTYAGAWVVWRDGDPDYGYVGWAPMGPDWYWYNGYAVGWTFGYTPYYSYCHRDYFWGGPGYYGHVIRGGDPRYHDIEAHTHPYNPGGGRGGNGEPGNRTAANPTVGGGGRIAANPRVGPSPSQLGMKQESVVPPPSSNPGLTRAQQLAVPRTAVAQGAAAPSQVRRRRPDDRALAAQAAEPRGGDRGLGNSSRLDPVARAPQYNAPGNGVAPRSNGSSAMNAAPRSSFGGSPSGATPMSATPSPSYRSAPSYSAPSYSAPQNQVARPSQAPSVASRPVERSAPTFRSAPSAPSSPSFRSAPSQTRSAPPSVAARPSAPSRPSMPSSSPSRPASRSSSSASKKR